jgi:protocatechuate 3,4-dioxygenase beta subunit
MFDRDQGNDPGPVSTDGNDMSNHRDRRLDEDHDHDKGLAFDLPALLRRRQALKLLGGAGAFVLAGCASTKLASSGASSVTSSAIPEETAGPYPGDGSNGPDVLARTGVVRSDIRTSLGSSSAVPGVPFTIKLQLVKIGGTPLAGAAVYLWHCDQAGRYSMYSSGVTDETFLRGVQPTGSDGNVNFTSIFPGCYAGRWPHVHYEVYPSLAKATSGTSKVATSQLALPESACKAVYATSGYASSVTNLSQVSLATDMVFSDGAGRETPVVTGNPASGYVASLVVPVKV